MKRSIIIVMLVLYATCMNAYAKSSDSNGSQESGIIGRPYKSFDTSAFCSYQKFHPSAYLTDNNWDILCAFTESGPAARLDSLGIPYTASQLKLLEVGDLLSFDGSKYRTSMHIFDKSETDVIRRESREFADSIFPSIQLEIKEFISECDRLGYSKQVYSLVFSYLLDTYIWDDERLASPVSCEDHGTWSGAYWAMYDSRSHDKIGTNGYGPVKQNWTDNLGYWLSSAKLISYAKEVMKTNGARIEDVDVVNAVAGWGLTDEKGNIVIPVIHKGDNSTLDLISRSITDKLSQAVKKYCSGWNKAHEIAYEKLVQIIFYHEVMWDLLDILESKQMISMPAILRGEEVGKEHFGDICFIVLNFTT